MKDQLSKYLPQIEDITAHAKSIGFDPINGNYEELYKSWQKQNNKFYSSIQKNKDPLINRLKNVKK